MKSNTIPLMIKCPDCGGKARLAWGWLPPKGLDPCLRMYVCTVKFCRGIWYTVKVGSLPDIEPI